MTAALVAVVGAIVLGIFGMHGFTQHGPMPGHGNHQAVAATPTSDASAGHAAMELGVPGVTAMADGNLDSAPTTDGAAVAAGESGGTIGDMAMLCAAIVLAAAAGVLLALRLRRLAHGTVLGLKSRVLTFRGLVSERLDTGPPAVWEFSVVRC